MFRKPLLATALTILSLAPIALRDGRDRRSLYRRSRRRRRQLRRRLCRRPPHARPVGSRVLPKV